MPCHTETENIRCILCNADEVDFVIEEGGYKAIKCKRCGLIYVNPRPKFAALKAKYSDGSLVQENKDIAAVDERSLKAKLNLVLIKKYKNSGKILDIGCAEGSFLAEANKLGYEPYGIEIIKKFDEYAKNK